MSRKSRRQRRQDAKVARAMERTLLRGTFRQELENLRFQDIKFTGNTSKLLEYLADKECLGHLVGIGLGLPETEVTQMIHDHEEELSYMPMPSGKLAQLLRRPNAGLPPLTDTDINPTKFDLITGKRI